MTSDRSQAWQPEHLAIIGVGLLGGSVALAAKQRWPSLKVVGSSRKEETRQRMIELGIVDQAYADVETCVASADLIVVAAPVVQIASMLPMISAASPPDATITDVGSTKQAIVDAAELDAAAAARFVGSHPIAGSEKSGLEYAVANLFRGKHCIVTSTDRTDQKRLEQVSQFWRQLECRVVTMSPQQHDTALAAASHMPHIVAAALAQSLPMEFASLTGTGFNDTTRIAAGDPLMWRQIVEANASSVLDQLERFGSRLESFRDAIKRADWDGVERLFSDARTAKQQILRVVDRATSPDL
ncbi:MAG: prephenate dehydrogenase/arogenate dehydrogenase family protein [Pirellulaceae bacterium]